MDLQTYIRAVRKGWWIILVGVALGAGLAALYIVRATPIYAAKVSLYLSSPTASGSSPQAVDQALQDLAQSYANLASSDRLASLVIKDKDLKTTPGAVAGQITGTPLLNTTIFQVTVRDPIPERALTIATGIGDQFPIMAKEIDPSTAKTTSIHVVSGPSVASTPVSPRKKLDLVAGFFGGLVLGLIAAIVRELLDTAIRSTEMLSQISRRPVLGQVTFAADARQAPLFIDEKRGGRRSEEYRQLRTNISFLDAADPISVLVVTSCVDQEGKSTTAANLAIVTADTDTRVLLIEADMRRPKASQYLGLDGTSGLTNVLVGQVGVDDVLQPWGDGGLTVLSSGPVPPNPSELLASKQMANLIKNLRDRFDLIVLDCPPLLPVTDAVVASRLADGVLVVVRHGKTRRDQLARAVADFETVDTRLLGTVLNMRPARGADSANLSSTYYASSAEPLRARHANATADNTADPAADGSVRARQDLTGTPDVIIPFSDTSTKSDNDAVETSGTTTKPVEPSSTDSPERERALLNTSRRRRQRRRNVEPEAPPPESEMPPRDDHTIAERWKVSSQRAR